MTLDPAAVDAARQAAQARQNGPPAADPRGQPPGGAQGPPGGARRSDPAPGEAVPDIDVVRAALRSGEVTEGEIRAMIGAGKLPAHFIQQLGFNRNQNPAPMPNPQRNRSPDPGPSPNRGGGAQAAPRAGGKSQSYQISTARQIMRTKVRAFLFYLFGAFGAINSVITTILCGIVIEEKWRGVPGTWSPTGVAISFVIALILFLAQHAFSDWDGPGIIAMYFIVLIPDIIMTQSPWQFGFFFPLFSNTMQNPNAAWWAAFWISLGLAVLSAKSSEWAYIGRPAKTLLDRIMGRG
jgi:hypothetical protein